MKIIEYNKLVRDNIPDIIMGSGKEIIISELDDKQYLVELKRKLVEESLEVQSADSKENMVDELADVIEVLEAIQTALQIDRLEIESVKNRKAKNKGRFEKKIFLYSVKEED